MCAICMLPLEGHQKLLPPETDSPFSDSVRESV